MKCISIKQPWAWAIFHGKDIENRVWSTKFRGDLLIHTGKTFDYNGFAWLLNHRKLLNTLLPGLNALDYGGGNIIGRVTMTGCVINSNSPWFFGPYGFTFENPILFKDPIPYRGLLKFFDVPDELVKE